MKTILISFVLTLFSTLNLSAQISVTVIDSSSLQPIPHFGVYLYGDSASSIYLYDSTDINGHLTFTNVGNSNYYIVSVYDCNYNLHSDTIYSQPDSVSFDICNFKGNCQANFFYYFDSITPLKVHYIPIESGSPTSWNWRFGDGINSSFKNPVHTYSIADEYDIKLSISSSNCYNTAYDSIIVPAQIPYGFHANFSAIPDTANPSTIHFTNLSTGNISNYFWYFDDDSMSSVTSPSHTYAGPGIYQVSLVCIPNSNSIHSGITKTLIITNGATLDTISGTVMAGNNHLDSGIVRLILPSTGALVAQTQVDSTGSYLFPSVLQGNYYLYAIPSVNSIYQNFAPSYYINHLSWTSADTLLVNMNKPNTNINLYQLTPMIGTNSISGSLSNSSKSGVAEIVVNLLTLSNTAIASTQTDSLGNFKFQNISDGTFKIWVEMAGKTTTPIIVTVNNSNPNSNNNDFVVKNNTIIPKTISIANIQKRLQMKAYPNPVENQLNIEINNEYSTQVIIDILNLEGQQLISKTFHLQSGSQTLRINLSDLSTGSYILKLSNQSGIHSEQLIIKIK